jgi:hypothetical protein
LALRLSRLLSASAVASFYIGVAAVGCSESKEGVQTCSGADCGIPVVRCDTDTECPPGNYCNTTAHECTADCYNDSACPADKVCSKQGRCIVDEDELPVPPPNLGGMPGIVPNVGGSSSGSGGSGGSCVKAEVTFSKQIPNIMLVIDRSGSMKDDFGGAPRWNVLREALIDPADGFVTDLEDEVRFGVALYTAPDQVMMPQGGRRGTGGRGGTTPTGGRGGGGGSGGVAGSPAATGGTVAATGGISGAGGSAGSAPTCPWLVEVPVALNNLAPISAVYLPNDWQNHTPTGESMAAVWPKVAAIDQTVMPGPNFIILATDGEPNMCADDNLQEEGRAASVAAVTAAKAAGITTYVVSVGDEVGEEHLRQLANLGQGLPADDPMNRFYLATDTMTLKTALREIILGVRPCEFDLDGTVNLEKADEGTVVIDNVSLTYNDPNGWTLVSDKRIKLQGTACNLIREGATMVNIDFPCGVFIPLIPE